MGEFDVERSIDDIDANVLERVDSAMPLRHARTSIRTWWEPLTNDRGALLIEAVVAISVFVTVFTMSMVAISTALKSSQNLETRAVAENIARNQLEWIVSLPYSVPDIGYTAPRPLQITARPLRPRTSTRSQMTTMSKR